MKRPKQAVGGVALVAIATITVGLVLVPPAGVAAQSPDPASSVSLTAEPLLGGSFRPGSWAAMRVRLENDGPAIEGELRMSTTARQSSTFSLPIQLPPGARQEHVIYGPMQPIRTRFVVSLVSGATVHATATIPVEARNPAALGVVVVAERPEQLVGSVRAAASLGSTEEPEIVAVTPENLPLRVDPWSAVDVLVWHDVDSNRLDAAQLDALRTWVAMGGTLVVVAGSTGVATGHAVGLPVTPDPNRPVAHSWHSGAC